VKRFQKILAGIDLSVGNRLVGEQLTAPNREVVRQAIALAAQSSAALCFYTALDVPEATQQMIVEQRGTAGTVLEEAREVLQALAAEAAQKGVAAEIVAEPGSSWQRLIERVRKHQHDLLIVGTRDSGLVTRILFGSTAMKVLRYCPCPVWVTKPRIDDGKTVILAAHDLTDVGQRALELAASIAKLSGGTLLVFHAYETTPHYGLAGSDVSGVESKLRYKSAMGQLSESISMLETLPVHEIVLREGKPELELLTVLEQRDVDLVVMGTKARTGFGAMLIGNTAERLLPELKCSVLALKPEGYVCPV